MHLIWKRYSRSRAAPPWFYAAFGVGFAALAVWAIVQGDSLMATIAVVMVAVTFAGARVMRRIDTPPVDPPGDDHV